MIPRPKRKLALVGDFPDEGHAVTEVMDAAGPSGWDWRDDTITSFPAIRDDDPPPAYPDSYDVLPDDAAGPVLVSDAWMPCPCGSGKPLVECDGRALSAEPGTDVMLSCASGVTSHVWRARLANGEIEDVGTLFDQAHADVHQPALKENRRIRAALAAARHDIAALFDADPPAHSDPALSRELLAMGERITAGGAR